MSLIPRAIALQGIGYGALLVALHGLVGVTVEPPAHGGGAGGSFMIRPPPLRIPVPADRQRKLREDDEILAFIATVIASGLLDQQ